jgi:hypothetical protein
MAKSILVRFRNGCVNFKSGNSLALLATMLPKGAQKTDGTYRVRVVRNGGIPISIRPFYGMAGTPAEYTHSSGGICSRLLRELGIPVPKKTTEVRVTFTKVKA